MRWNLTLLLLISFPCFSQGMGYFEAEKALNSQASRKHLKTEEFKNSENIAVNEAWGKTGRCFKFNIESRTVLIIQVTEKGEVHRIWTDAQNQKSDCLKKSVSHQVFPNPPWQPYFLKVVM